MDRAQGPRVDLFSQNLSETHTNPAKSLCGATRRLADVDGARRHGCRIREFVNSCNWRHTGPTGAPFGSRRGTSKVSTLWRSSRVGGGMLWPGMYQPPDRPTSPGDAGLQPYGGGPYSRMPWTECHEFAHGLSHSPTQGAGRIDILSTCAHAHSLGGTLHVATPHIAVKSIDRTP